MSSLPPDIPNRLQASVDISAYNICLRLERSLQLAVEDVENNVIYVRILGYLIHYVPTDEGLRNIVGEITACADDSALLALGKLYFDHFIRPFRASRSHTPTPFSDESPVSFNTTTEMTTHTFLQPHADARKNALIRDGYRCIATGRYDFGTLSKNRELAKQARLNATGAAHLQCAHIFSESTNLDTGRGPDKGGDAPNLWTIIERFGYEGIPAGLNDANVHQLENVMTLCPDFHELFNRLEIWFVAVNGKLNTYKLHAIEPLALFRCPEYVTFTTPDPVKLPVPSPAYLAIHALCCQVAHLSGAAEWIDKLYQDMNGCMTLSPDGTSSSILEHAIFELQARGERRVWN